MQYGFKFWRESRRIWMESHKSQPTAIDNIFTEIKENVKEIFLLEWINIIYLLPFILIQIQTAFIERKYMNLTN